jgi:hypothetical protein
LRVKYGLAVESAGSPSRSIIPSGRRYFDTELVSDTWSNSGVEVTQRFWRRPLSAILDAFADAGFVVERLVEPQPSPAAQPQFTVIAGPTECRMPPQNDDRRVAGRSAERHLRVRSRSASKLGVGQHVARSKPVLTWNGLSTSLAEVLFAAL